MKQSNHPISRQILLRAGFCVIATLIFVAGCATSSDISEVDSLVETTAVTTTTAVATSTTVANNSTTLPSVAHQGTEAANSEVKPSDTLSTTTTILDDIETQNGEADLPSDDDTEIDTAESPELVLGDSVSVPSDDTNDTEPVEQMRTPELTKEMIILIDRATDACAEPLEFECSSAVWKACEMFKGYISEMNISEMDDEGKEGMYDISSLLCRAASNAQLSELATVLSAKYGIEFYEGGFYRFRITDYFSGIHLDLYGIPASGQENYPNISANTKEVLSKLFDKIGDFYSSSTYQIVLKDEIDNRNILYSFHIEADAANNSFCPEAVRLYLSNEEWENAASECKRVVCHFEETYIERICSPSSDVRRGFSATEVASIVLYWYMLPTICANSELKEVIFSTDDLCIKFAIFICDIFESATANSNFVSIDTPFAKIRTATCGLAAPLKNIPGDQAQIICFSEIKNIRISVMQTTEGTDNCSSAANECITNSKIISDKEICEALVHFPELELLWKNLPAICAKQFENNREFSSSECHIAIEQVCNFEIANYHKLPDGYYTGKRADNLEDRDSHLSDGSCPLVYPWRWNTQINDLGYSSFERISGPPREPHFVQHEEVSSNLSADSFVAINSAANICLHTLIAPLEANCASAVWNACYVVESEKSTYKGRPTELSDSEVSEVASYICSVAYFAELGELIEAISLSYGDTYFVNNFSVFLNRIPNMIRYGDPFEFYFNQRLYMLPQAQENLSEEAKQQIAIFGDSISNFFFHYIENNTNDESTNV